MFAIVCLIYYGHVYTSNSEYHTLKHLSQPNVTKEVCVWGGDYEAGPTKNQLKEWKVSVYSILATRWNVVGNRKLNNNRISR